ncbi:MAG TPA: FMN-binding negative transcriptional regulator [Candidatus Kryptobacter bacterium]|nr:FMN-binding negative transcriptional regulator [Candidatus Kryptobacter bacterium]
MYVPAYFKIDDWPEISRFIRENPLATLVSRGEEYPVATHIPLELEEDGKVLSGHVAKGNPHWRLFEEHPQVLAIFLSPVQHYISSSWYNHPNVPTWNYMAVHVYGKIRIVDGERLRKSLERMTFYHERISPHPLTPEVLQSEIDKQIGGIVGFEIDMERVEGAYKMSQNRNDEDYANIMKELERLDDYNARMVAKRMSEIRKVD